MLPNDPDAGDGVALWRAACATAVTPARVAAGWAACALVDAAPERLGALRIAAEAVQRTGPDGAPTTLSAVVTVTDETTGVAATLPVSARVDGARLTVDADGPLTLADLPRDARVTVLTVWWRRGRATDVPPTVADVRALVVATAAAHEVPDPDLAEAVLLRIAPAVVHRVAADPETGMDDLAFLVDAFSGTLPARVRWTAQNALLRARDTVLPTMRDRDDPEAARWLAAFRLAAEHLTVAI